MMVEQPAVAYLNPVHVGPGRPMVIWETVADVVDDYFPDFAYEQPVRLVDSVITEGRLESFPRGSPTMFEPWRRDAAGGFQELENTLQSMRRYAVVRVIPDEGGYLVDLAVYKELEDVPQPEGATAGAATLRYDNSLRRIDSPVGDQPLRAGWIPQGRDYLLEQKMLSHLLTRLGQTTATGPVMIQPSPDGGLQPIPMTDGPLATPPDGRPAVSLPPADDRPLVPVD